MMNLYISIMYMILMEKLRISTYIATQWQLFINSSKQSLKCVLLYNGNLFGAVLIGHSVCLWEDRYKDIKRVIYLLQYHIHQWIIYVELKTVCFLLGQHCGYTK
ncbi:hypothetical protein X975_22777, partial [Stegodyphus mimosarum]